MVEIDTDAGRTDKIEFSYWGRIQRDMNGTIRFAADEERSLADTEVGFVYTWLLVSGDIAAPVYDAECLYVGQAGSTLERRFDQHEAGFRHSPTGRKHKVRIEDELIPGRRVEVWARCSAKSEVFGVSVSMCAVEESALICRWTPRFNRVR